MIAAALRDFPEARLYFRPTAFVDAPFGLDGRVKRLAGGLLWFSALEAIVVAGGRRVAADLVPIDRLAALIDSLPTAQREAAMTIVDRLADHRSPLTLGERVIRLNEPQVMAILNMTPDSFSDGGRFETDPQGAAAAAVAMAADGAAIIDVGGESTRPRAATVWEGDEIARTLPVIERLARSGTAVSIDTRKAAVMEAGLAVGAHLVNDVSALLYDPRSAAVVAHAGCPVVLMHHQGSPETMQDAPRYDDVLIEVYDWLEARIAAAGGGGNRSRADHRRSRHRLRQGPAAQPGADQWPVAVPRPRLPDPARRQPQAADRRAIERGAGGGSTRRIDCTGYGGYRARSADRPRARCGGDGAGDPGMAGLAGSGADASGVKPGV